MLERIIAVFALAASLVANAAEWPAGKPLSNTFPLPQDQAAQVFTVAQGADEAMYLGGTMGLMRFDGSRWRAIALPGSVRRLEYDGGRMWVGGYNAFGFLERDATGKERFVDLAPKFAAEMAGREFADIWSIHPQPEAI